MKINRIEIDAFMTIGEVTMDLDSKGLVLIQGENEDDSSQDSNGSGKSTVAEALCWCLYNETARGDSGDEIVNRTLKKDTRVLAQLVDGPRTYNVIRHRKHKVHKNRVLLIDVTDPAEPIDLTQGTDKATQEQIVKLVGCTSEVFRAAIYSGQESHIDLPSLTDKSLKVIVEEAAGINKMQDAHTLARFRVTEKKQGVDKVERAIEKQQAALDATNAGIEKLHVDADLYEKNRSEKVATELAAMKDSALKAKALQVEIAAIDEDMLKAARDTASARIASADDEWTHLSKLTDSEAKAKFATSTLRKKLADEKSHAEHCKGTIAHVESEIGTSCKSCGHVLGAADVAGRISSVKVKAVEHVTAAKAAAAELADAQAAFDAAQKAVEDYRRGMTDLSAETAKLRELDEAQRELHAKKLQLQSLVEKARTHKARAATIEVDPNPYLDTLAKYGRDVTAFATEIDKLTIELNVAKDALQVAEQVAEVFSPAGIRAHILDTVTPFLNDRTARYLSILSDGNIQAVWNTISTTAKGELREKFEIGVSSRTGGSSYRSLSGGEKRKVRLSTALALQDLVSSRAAKPIRLWIGDEIDDAVDDAGLERLMTVLEEKAKEKGTVLIISHNPIRDWVRQHVTVRKKGGIAAMEGVLCVERDRIGE